MTEIAHWCVAGPERRKQEDFGCWYKPDGRSVAEQGGFERVEVRPRAYEWILSLSAGKRFHFSIDNLSSGLWVRREFQERVLATVHQIIEQGMNPRLSQLSLALLEFYQQPKLSVDPFYLEPELSEAG